MLTGQFSLPQRTVIETKVVETRREHFTDVLEELRKKGTRLAHVS